MENNTINIFHSDKAQNVNFPLFFAYTIEQIPPSNSNSFHSDSKESQIFYFKCNKCCKIFKEFNNLKRHVIEVEFGIKQKCKYCGFCFKRINEHQKTCKYHCSNNEKLPYVTPNKKKNELKTSNKKSEEFNLYKATLKFIKEFKINNDYKEINNSYIYFTFESIGEGSYGNVAFGLKVDENLPVAVKIQINAGKKDVLKIEKDILSILPVDSPFQKVFYHETNPLGNVLIESLAGPTLDKLYIFCDCSFDIITICNIAIDVITSLELLHSLNYIHNDIKLDNIAILFQNYKNDTNNVACSLIDLGKASKIEKKKKTRLFGCQGKRIKGNLKFASLNSLNEGEALAKDDMESLCYLLLYLNNNGLPWSNIPKSDKNKYKEMVIKEKKEFKINNYCGDNFHEIITIFNDLKNLASNEKPKYAKYKNLFSNIIERNGGSNKGIKFAWEKKFSEVIYEFRNKNNFQLLNDTIKYVFKGYPEQLAFDFINQFGN